LLFQAFNFFSQTPLNLGKTDENEDGIIKSKESEQKSKSPQSSDSVTCPVCSSKLAAQDHIINSHLGMDFDFIFN